MAESTPIISRALPDGTLAEAIYDAERGTTALAVRKTDGTLAVVEAIDTTAGERLVPYSPTNALITSGCVLLPSDLGDIGDIGDVICDIRSYLARYVDLAPDIEELVPYYILLTWVYDAFNELPYLRFLGDWGSGKTRRLLTIGSVCYKPFFASGASTVSPIFHILDGFGGTMILDEADFRFSDSTADITKVLNNGNVNGLPVLRTMTNRHKELSPQAFRVFGPKVLAMRERFQDPALESRFVTEVTSRKTLPPHIPIHLPRSLKAEAGELRNRLLAWRLTHFHEIEPKPERLIEGAAARTNQMAMAVLSLIDDAEVRKRVARSFQADGQAREAVRRDSIEGRVLAAAIEAFQTVTHRVGVADIAYILNRKSSEELHLPVSNKWVGAILRTRLGITTEKSHGVYVVLQTERARIWQLAESYGLDVSEQMRPEQPAAAADLHTSTREG